MKCGRGGCFVCRSEKGGSGKCMKDSVLYSIICEECKRQNVESEYWGETGRDCYTRGGEHLTGIREQREDNPMWKHVWDKHDGEGEEKMFSMRMEQGFRKPLARQIREGVEIDCSKNTLMNSKSEWNSARIPRIIIEEGERQEEDETSGLGRQGGEKKMSERQTKTKKVGMQIIGNVERASKRQCGDMVESAQNCTEKVKRRKIVI